MNNLANPNQPLVDEDQHLIDFALQVLERLEEETQHDGMGTMRRTIAELDAKTQIVVEKARSHRLQASAFGLGNSDPTFAFLDPILIHGTGASSGDDHAFAGDFGSANAVLDAELFGSWLETQFFDVGASLAESAPSSGKANPNFDGVVAEFLKQSWF